MERRQERGFTLVEVVFGVVIMAMMVSAVGGLFLSNLQSVTLGKSRALGLAVANEQIEYLRDLPYDSLATQNGTIYPPGSIPDSKTVTLNNFRFTVLTEISYVDDAYDGYITCPCASGPAAGKPKDLYPYDYKKAQVTVKLATSGQVVSRQATDIAGKAAETSSNTGILSITVINASGQPVPNAVVTVVNPNPTPAVNISTTTDNNGLVVIPKLPPYSNNSYQVTASLPGYSTDGTIADPSGAQTAVLLNPNVLAQQITSLTFSIDQVSTLYLNVKNTAGAPVSGLNVTTTGGKEIKQNPTVYKTVNTSATDASGNITLSGIEWDSYSFSVPAGWYVVSSSPGAPVSLAPNSAATVNLVVTNDSDWPTISSFSPDSAQTGTTPLTIAVTGRNLESSATLKLAKAGQSDITATGCVSSGGNTTLTCSLNLTGAATGAWDVVITNSGDTATQTGGFDVVP